MYIKTVNETVNFMKNTKAAMAPTYLKNLGGGKKVVTV